MAAQGERDKDKAYEYLCHLEEAKKWLESVIAEPLPPASELEDALQNGVVLCKLGLNLMPDDPIWRKVYDINESKFKSKGLDYRHTDNINFWLSSLQKLGLPKVFYPVMTDIYHKKNMPKLIYCLHALSHLLQKQGKVAHAVDDLYGTAKFSQDALVQTSKTLKANDLPAFGVVENLVDEELQYQAIGLTDSFEEERTPSPNDVTPVTKLSDPLFDDPKYVSSKMLREGPQAGNEPTDGASDGNAEASSTPVVVVPCQGNGIRTTLYERHNTSRRRSSTTDSKVEDALQLVNESLEKEDPKETLKSLQNPEANLPFVYQDADKYLAALRMEKERGMPNNILQVFSGIDRELCEFLLEKMNPGAYIVRDSRTLQGAYVFSFRNQTGIKHWRLNTNNGKFYWGTSAHYDSLDSFVQHFVQALSLVTKLHIYPGMATVLQPMFNTPEQQTIIDSLRQADSGLTYGQVCSVIKQVNSEIRQTRKSSLTAEQLVESMARPQDEETWATSMVVNVNRAEAESILNKEGEPGSFVVRPSEKTQGDYALAFRTKTDIRHWKITQDSGKYYVHPRPNPYNSLEDIILVQKSVWERDHLSTERIGNIRRWESVHFREAVGLEIGLTMRPLQRTPTNQDTKEDSSSMLTPPIPLPRSSIKSSTMGRTAMPTASMSKLNPANLTSWSVDDVCQWLTEQGLGRFIDIFRENAVDGECLLSLDNNLLKEDLGISALGHRSRLLKRVQVLRESVHPGIS